MRGAPGGTPHKTLREDAFQAAKFTCICVRARKGVWAHPQAGLVAGQEMVVRGAACSAAQNGLHRRIDVQLRRDFGGIRRIAHAAAGRGAAMLRRAHLLTNQKRRHVKIAV